MSDDLLEFPRLLVTGATGYVGGRLVLKLLEQGYPLRVMVRDPQRLQGRTWTTKVDVKQGDVLQVESLSAALENIDIAYYLVHSMNTSADYHERDLVAARNFGTAAASAGVKRIIYLGGLGDSDTDLSQHLRSRQMTGEALRQAGVPVTEFRAAVVVGSGSLSFEMVRYLTERVPIMICPRWVYTRIQPISINDVLQYLLAVLDNLESKDKIIEIGGADVTTYGGMMLGYARQRGLKRHLVPVPVLTPRLSSYWVHWVTPIPSSIAEPLIEGLRNEVIVRDRSAMEIFPDIQPLDYQSAVALALDTMVAGQVETAWSDALTSSQGDLLPVQLGQEQGLILERRQRLVNTPPKYVYRVFTGLGGNRGWLIFNFAWRLRGMIDRLAGGVGMRRGRRAPDELRVGDAVDFWRVEAVDFNRLLRLRAEMKVPGKAWLQFESKAVNSTQTMLIQTAFFDPKGLGGLLYWYALYPFHAMIFGGMVARIGEQAETEYRKGETDT